MTDKKKKLTDKAVRELFEQYDALLEDPRVARSKILEQIFESHGTGPYVMGGERFEIKPHKTRTGEQRYRVKMLGEPQADIEL